MQRSTEGLIFKPTLSTLPNGEDWKRHRPLRWHPLDGRGWPAKPQRVMKMKTFH